MSTATLETPANSDPIPIRSDTEKAKQLSYLWRLAHEAMMLNEAQKTKARAARLEKFAANADVAALNAPLGDDEMGVSVGNETHNHITIQMPTETADAPPPEAAKPPADTPATAAAATSPVATTPATKIRRGIWGFVVPALLGAGSLGCGAAGMAIYNWATDRPDSVTTITQPSTGKFEYRYGIEQRPTPSQ